MSECGDLISELTRKGNEQDAVLGGRWAALPDAFTKIQIKVARGFSYDMGADMEADVIANGMLNEEMGKQFREAYELVKPLCESPIERIIAPWLIAQRYYGFVQNPCVLRPGESAKYVPYTVAVIPQLPIGRYRADFALAASRRDGKIRFVIVECDGAQFHDGVPNVVKDIHRDVSLLANDRVLDVVRLEGREIYRDPQKAADKVAKAVKWAWSVANEEVAHKFAATSGEAA